MKLILILLTTIFIFSSLKPSYSQRILFQSDFENLSLSFPDSLPQGWKKLDADSNFFGIGKSWAIRDTNQILGGDTIVNRPHAHSGKKSLHISWFSGKGGSYVSDDWVWTDSLRIHSGDSLIFWSLLGNIEGIAFYVDSVQIWICSSQSPNGAFSHLTTLISNLDTIYNIWTQNKFDLSQFVGQRIYIAFRYYLPVQKALWCNIDDMLIGNRSSLIGIKQIGTNIPSQFSLSQNYPNPFNPKTKIKYEIPLSAEGGVKRQASNVKLIIYNALGRKIATLVDEKQNAGVYSVTFDGSSFATGVYFYKLISDGPSTNSPQGILRTGQVYTETKKMILIK